MGVFLHGPPPSYIGGAETHEYLVVRNRGDYGSDWLSEPNETKPETKATW
jgi:hypothetical protein